MDTTITEATDIDGLCAPLPRQECQR